MIEIKGLGKNYSSVKVYENFNLDIDGGKVTCILGESGSGKTTLLNCIAGLTPYAGEITPTECSYIFQNARLVPNLTVYGNLKLVCADDGKIAEMLERVHLSDKARSYPKKLSGGQAQRAAIARAFLFGAPAMLMDEPFASLDLKLKRDMTELFFSIWRNDGRTVLMVTHDIDEAVSMAHRIIVLRSGKIALDTVVEGEPPRGACADPLLRERLVKALMGE